jgi:hypothetical protein
MFDLIGSFFFFGEEDSKSAISKHLVFLTGYSEKL